jgi:hypothetical protein
MVEKNDKLDLISGFDIFSRRYQKKIIVNDRKFYEFTAEGVSLINDSPSEEEVNKLCDDMFYEEFGEEPDEHTIKNLSKIMFNFDDIIN